MAPGALTALLEALARPPEADLEVAPAPLPQTGAVIGRYELLREVGRGNFGVVYEARDRELRRSVAFKLVRAGHLADSDDQHRREAELIARLSHPNLVTIFDAGHSDHGPYLVLEYLRGETLQVRLARGRLEPAEAVRLATELARGLAYAHEHGVVHRDLKPSNVFVCEDGPVKLLDFGLAHAFGWRRLDGGTPAYMAPEQWRRAPEDERTDVFALGAILFQMLSGELPFPVGEHGRAILSERAAPSLETPGHPGLAGLVGRMLEKDVTRRPRDGRQVLAALTALRGEIERAGLPGPVRKVRRRARRALAMAAAGALLGAVVWAGVRFGRGGPAAPPLTRAIAVLPFANLGAGAESDYFSDGLAEEILNLLTRVRELKVAAGASSFGFKGRKVELADVAHRLGVDVVLVGSVRREKEHLRVGAELVDARSGFRVWSEIYDRRLEDVFAIQDDIARQVVGALAIVLSRTESELRKPPTPDLVAYDLYLRGRAALRLPVTAEHLDQAAAAFDQAIARDGAFGPAHAGLCEAWLGRYELGRAPDSFARAERACREALARGSDAAELHVALGRLHLASGRHADAERDFRKALSLPERPIEALLGLARVQAAQHRTEDARRTFDLAHQLEPGDRRVYDQTAAFLFANGRYAEAAAQFAQVVSRTAENAEDLTNLGAAHYLAGNFEQASRAWHAALALSPNVAAYSNVGSSYYYLRRFEDAAAMYRKAIELTPEDHRLWGNLGDAYMGVSGRTADARRAYEKAVALAEQRLHIDATDAQASAELAHYHARLGHAAQARALAREAVAADARNPYVRYYAALVSVTNGELDLALDHLERALALGYQPEVLAADAGLAALRDEPRFKALSTPRRSRSGDHEEGSR